MGNFAGFEYKDEVTGELLPFLVPFEVTPNKTTALIIGLTAGGGGAAALGIAGGFLGRMFYKRKKFGMKRHVDSFMDDFNVHQ
jgi:hypothetical protein